MSRRWRRRRPSGPQPYSSHGGRPLQHAEAVGGDQAGGAAAELAARQAELNRRKEPLEAYPLDSMAMVGSVARGAQPFALLRVDNLLYQVKVGDYLGQNYGRMTRIAETEVSLREIVQDAAGEWIERTGDAAAAGEGAMSQKRNPRRSASCRSGGPVWRPLVFGCSLPLAAWAQNAIQSITSSQQAGTEVVRIEMKEPLAAVPAGFSIQAPPRIAIDLPGMGNDLGRNSVDINQGNLRSVSVAQAGERTRLVLNLKQAASYTRQDRGQGAGADPAGGGAAPQVGPAGQAEATQFAPSQNTEAQGLRDIDFRRGADGTGRVVVTCRAPRSASTSASRAEPGGRIPALDAARQPAPAAGRVRLRHAGAIRVDLPERRPRAHGRRAHGDWEHSAYQSDNQFVLEVRPMKVDPNKLTQGPGYQGEKLS
jgi:Tfp pilus assembly protein PilP